MPFSEGVATSHFSSSEKQPTISLVPRPAAFSILELVDNNTQKQKSSDKQAILGEFIR